MNVAAIASSLRARPVPVGPKSTLLLILVSVAGFAMFFWPLWVPVHPDPQQHVADAPFLFVVVLPVLVLLVLTQLTEGGMDAKVLAMLGVLSAVNAAIRPLGAGLSGIETVFFLLILAGRVFGPGFGFVLGCTSLFASALLTVGVGPWLPFQMITSAWIGMGAGLLPGSIGRRPLVGRTEIVMLAGYGVFAAYFFGLLMNMWFWPFVTGIDVDGNSSLAYIPGGSVAENLHRFLVFSLLTSTASWDTGRAITNAVAIVVVGPAVLAVLRRSVRRANFNPDVQFIDPEVGAGSSGSPKG
jgi:energy-coupling factor transport system substrate-specific component